MQGSRKRVPPKELARRVEEGSAHGRVARCQLATECLVPYKEGYLLVVLLLPKAAQVLPTSRARPRRDLLGRRSVAAVSLISSPRCMIWLPARGGVARLGSTLRTSRRAAKCLLLEPLSVPCGQVCRPAVPRQCTSQPNVVCPGLGAIIPRRPRGFSP